MRWIRKTWGENLSLAARSMSSSTPSDERRLVELLDPFEAALQRWQTPRIEDYLQRVEDHLRPQLLFYLVRLEQELGQPGRRPTPQQYVVKVRESGEFFQLGEEEFFLLQQLDEQREANEIRAAFDEHFGEPLSADDLDDFLEMCDQQGLVTNVKSGETKGKAADDETNPPSEIRNPNSKQSILYWRKSLFAPDRFFTWLEPKIRFFWTRAFLLCSAACILFAGGYFQLFLWSLAVLVWRITMPPICVGGVDLVREGLAHECR